MRRLAALPCAAILAIGLPQPGRAATDLLAEIVVTPTRLPVPVEQVPAAISVVSGRELSERGAADLSAVLSLVAGAEAPAGGDAGPSGAVPAFWGLHEFDAFLLVVDGVPWGGAFNPAITTLDFTDVERVEILKGAAPVMYGATSFVGVVQAIHYPAGAASNELSLALGTYGSFRGSVALVLPSPGALRHSLAVDAEDIGFSDAREVVSRDRVLYRGALPIGAGQLTLDADLTRVRNVPPSPVLRAGSNLTPLTPIDANFNPADTRIDEDRYHVSIGYAQPTAWGEWTSLASYAYSGITDVRAFLHPDLSGTADTQSQRRHIDDAYLDTHLVRSWSNDASLIAGIDVLYGRGRQTTQNGNDAYTVPLDGSVLPPAAASVMPNETGTLDDRRLFAGQYAQLTWKLDRRWEFVAGLRLNEIVEHKDSSDATTSPQAFDSASVRSRIVRPSETLAASYRAWQAGVDEGILFASFRNTFKPAAVDFGPDYTPDLLSPETARSYELGLKGAAAGRRLSYQAELFLMDFSNLVVATSSGALANAAAERLKGVEGEARFEVAPQLTLAASAAYHEATYTRYLYFDGVSNVDVAGRSLPLSPQIIIAGGILYTPPRGASATAIARYVGRRYLDEGNTAPVGGYTTLDSSLGYAWGRLRLTLEGTNLTDRRPPVTSSEFGSQSFYVLPARMAWVRAAYRLR